MAAGGHQQGVEGAGFLDAAAALVGAGGAVDHAGVGAGGIDAGAEGGDFGAAGQVEGGLGAQAHEGGVVVGHAGFKGGVPAGTGGQVVVEGGPIGEEGVAAINLIFRILELIEGHAHEGGHVLLAVAEEDHLGAAEGRSAVAAHQRIEGAQAGFDGFGG